MNIVSNITILFFSSFYGILFGLIDSMFFLFAEEHFNEYFTKNTDLSENEIDILLGAISAAVSILVASIIKIYISNKTTIKENPLFDVIGILIGCFIVIFLHRYRVIK